MVYGDYFLTGVWGRSHMAHDSSSGADAKAESAKRDVDQLEARLERALLTMEAMWTLLRDQLEMSDEELTERIVEIDLTDGVLDGKVRRGAAECHACKRRIPRRFARCMYCGVDVERDPFT